MPSLIFHGGNLNDTEKQASTEESILQSEKATIEQSQPINSAVPASLRQSAAYHPGTRRLMWLAVILLTLIICSLWAWSIMNQFYNIKWSASPEKIFISDLKSNWDNSFRDENKPGITAEQVKNDVKESLSKLFAATAQTNTTKNLSTVTNTVFTTNTNP